MPLPDVAAALRIPLGTAKSRLHRSLGVLRSSIVEGEGGDRLRAAGGQLA
jgi:DNA-directed RNA polymerase specialized sigma24 family protein